MPMPSANEISRCVWGAGHESVALPLDGMHYMPDADEPVLCDRFEQNGYETGLADSAVASRRLPVVVQRLLASSAPGWL